MLTLTYKTKTKHKNSGNTVQIKITEMLIRTEIPHYTAVKKHKV